MSAIPTASLTPAAAAPTVASVGAPAARPAARPRRTGRPAILAALAAMAITALGALAALAIIDHTRATAPRRAQPAPAGLIRGVPLQLARCRDWVAAPVGERNGALAGLAQSVGGASTTGGYGTTLDPAAAAALFDRHCQQPAEDSILLYEIYIRAAAFR